jgi:hypothetical protein
MPFSSMATDFFASRRAQLATLAARDRIRAAYWSRDVVAVGVLMSCGTYIANSYYQVGSYPSHILKGASTLMNVAWDLSCRHVAAALHFERTDITIEFGGAIASHIAIVHPACGVQHLIVEADADLVNSHLAKVPNCGFYPSPLRRD